MRRKSKDPLFARNIAHAQNYQCMEQFNQDVRFRGRRIIVGFRSEERNNPKACIGREESTPLETQI